jgi:hypothetical protein
MPQVLLALLLFAPSAVPWSTDPPAPRMAAAAAPSPFEFVAGPGVSATGWLGDFHPPLRGTASDSPLFVLEGELPGGTLFVIGGAHAGETAGILAALLLVERAEVEQGRIVVVPWSNALALDPARSVRIETPRGARRIALGGRRSLESHYGEADPETYFSPGGGEYPGNERRNLNRVWPGLAAGTPTEQVAFAVTEAIRAHESDLAFDLHETSVLGGNLPWTIAGRAELLPLLRASVSAVNRELGLDLARWREADTPPGMSRVEWGPATGAKAFLTETVIGHATPLPMRVAVQIAFIRGVVDAFNAAEQRRVEEADEREATRSPRLIRFRGVPGLRELADGDLGMQFQPPPLLEEPAAAAAP